MPLFLFNGGLGVSRINCFIVKGVKMKKWISLSIVLLLCSVSASASENLVRQQSQFSVEETANRFERIAKSKGLSVFARINHQKNASSVNMDLRPTELIIFGNPKVGTPLMLCAQEVAIDLPQKVLVTEDENKQVWLTYNDPYYLKNRHHIKNCDAVLNKVSTVLRGLSAAAVSQ